MVERPLSNNFNTTKVLVALLVVASFFIGSLWTKVTYLEKNPNLKGETNVQQTQPTQQNAAQTPAGKIKEVTDKDHIRGNKNAKLTLVDYSDYECPFCKAFHPTMLELMKIYGDKIRWVYRHFPLSFHANAKIEAEASECIAELGGNDKFWEFSDKIFDRTTSNGTGFALTDLGPLAAEIGVNQTQFQSCLDSGKYEKLAKDSIADGTTGGVNGTPATFIVNSKGETQLIIGAQPVDAFKTAIDKELGK